MHPNPNTILKSLILSLFLIFGGPILHSIPLTQNTMIGLSLTYTHMHTHFYMLFVMFNSSNQIIEFRLLGEKLESLEVGFIYYNLYVSGFLCNQHSRYCYVAQEPYETNAIYQSRGR